MIRQMMVITTGGLLCFSKNFVQAEFDSDLVSGFLTAMSSFAQEIKTGAVQSMVFQNQKFCYAIDEETNTSFVFIIDILDIEEEVREKLDLAKSEFLRRFSDTLKDWTGDMSVFKDFNDFVDDQVFLPPKILFVGFPGVGKTTILNLFPGETILELDEDLNEIIRKPVVVEGILNLKQVELREYDLGELVDNSKYYRNLLNSVQIICIVTSSASSNLGKTKRHFDMLKKLTQAASFYILANFQDQPDMAFEPEKIQELFDGTKTFGFSGIKKSSKEQMYEIMGEILKDRFLSQ
jgi:hypothetical protein